MIVVTSGARYIDIDAYAGCVAYAELLNLLGKPAVAVTTSPINESVPTFLRDLNAPLQTDYNPGTDDKFILVDVSDPSVFDPLVEEDRIIEVIDHHLGFEDYWHAKISVMSHIEFIGAAATLIYEQWENAGKLEQMSKVSAELLAAAILDNTLNFGANVTTPRDHAAYEFLTRHAGLDDKWVAKYFTDCQQAIMDDLPKALQNDTKSLQLEGLEATVSFGQLVIWDVRNVLTHELETLTNVMTEISETWLINVVSISEGKSHFVADNTAVQSWLENLLQVHFDGSIAHADRLWLRKEVMKAAL